MATKPTQVKGGRSRVRTIIVWAPKIVNRSSSAHAQLCTSRPHTQDNAMKIVSWNINGLRASIKNSGTSLKGLLDRLDADIICFQETKAQSRTASIQPSFMLQIYDTHTHSPSLFLSLRNAGDQLDSSMCIVDGYNAYFSFCRTKGGYSGELTSFADLH